MNLFFPPSPDHGLLRRRSGGRLGRPRPTPDHGKVGAWLVSEEYEHRAAGSSADVLPGAVVPVRR